MNKLLDIFIKPFQGDNFVWIEIIIITAISATSWLYFYSLPVGVEANHFFWPLLGPLLIALRYGFAKGFICTLGMTAVLVSIMKDGGMLPLFPFSLIVGTFFSVMIAGEFRDHWQRSIDKYGIEHKHMQQELTSFTKNYHLLKVSHDQLELRNAGQPASLRAEINSLQRIALQYSERRLAHIGEPLLALFAHVGGIHVAGIYKVKNNEVEAQPYAVLGDSHTLNINDCMLQDMLVNKKLLSPVTFHAQHESCYQLCIPLVDTAGVLQAVVLAESVKFFLLTPANVVLLSLIADNAADLLSDELLTPVLATHQDDLFMRYVQRAHYNSREYAIDSSLIIFHDHTGENSHELDALTNHRRGSDVYWTYQPPNKKLCLMVLLPLTTATDSQLFITRMQQILFNALGEHCNDIDIIGPFSFEDSKHDIDSIIKIWGPNNDRMLVPSCANS